MVNLKILEMSPYISNEAPSLYLDPIRDNCMFCV